MTPLFFSPPPNLWPVIKRVDGEFGGTQKYTQEPFLYPVSKHLPPLLFQTLKSNLASVPELSAIVGPTGCQAVTNLASSASEEEKSAALKQAYSGLMTSGEEEVSEQVTKLIERLEKEQKVSST